MKHKMAAREANLPFDVDCALYGVAGQGLAGIDIVHGFVVGYFHAKVYDYVKLRFSLSMHKLLGKSTTYFKVLCSRVNLYLLVRFSNAPEPA